MPERLPLFPLPLVLFPGETLKLHIFEERYKQLIGECLESGAEFGIALHVDGRVAEYGSAARVAECFRRYDSGELDIAVEGTRVFHLESFERIAEGKLYPAGGVTWPGDRDGGAEHAQELLRLHNRLHGLLGVPAADIPEHAELLSFRLGHESGLTPGQKLELLSIPGEDMRRRYLLEHLDRAVKLLEAAAETRRRVQANGQFHRFPAIDL